MPIYEYRCAACGFQKEYLQKMSDAPLTKCPECGEPRFAKLVSAAGFQLKGSGWYATDFKQSAQPKPKAGDKPAAKAEDKSPPKPQEASAAVAPAKKSDAASTATSSTTPASS